MIDLEAAKQLLDLGARMGHGTRADEQLEGALAIHNMLRRHRVGYLADEVGMGKTYVALGAIALFRHFDPSFRLLVIAPRENIQHKWMKELSNFAAYNLRFPDLRFSSIDRRPVRPLVPCDRLIDLVRETAIDPNRDFFVRMPSFSLGGDEERWSRMRDSLREALPWLRTEALDLRSGKEAFKDNVARAVCCALPVFDLVVVDEAHNLKHGFAEHVAARNRVLALAMGRGTADAKLFPGYGPRAQHVLFLSATPLEESYAQIWNQLDVFGFGKGFEALKEREPDDAPKRAAAEFLVRRVTAVRIGDSELTKNQYRREWRRGGVHAHDEPIATTSDRQRLVVALVQKKVSELLGSERFNSSFQIGMLASFESFLETTRIKKVDEEPTFDDEEQTSDQLEREGLDVRDVNRLARDYSRTFGHEMPHPKMDAVVDALKRSWITGSKALVFVRRVASVRELKRRLDRHYDEWLIDLLRERLPDGAGARFEAVVADYEREKREKRESEAVRRERLAHGEEESEHAIDDHGGTDTFFAWFFRGAGPSGVITGANVKTRLDDTSFFELNHAAELLGAAPGGVLRALAERLGKTEPEAREMVRAKARRYLSRAKQPATADRMQAAQAAAVELLAAGNDELVERARLVWHERYESSMRKPHAEEAPDVSDALEQPTFFTELSRPERSPLRNRIWPEPTRGTDRERFREREIRAQLLATAARLGHAFIDLYLITVRRLATLELGKREAEESLEGRRQRIAAYLDELERQCQTPREARRWAAFDELADIAAHFELVLDVNAPTVRDMGLEACARSFGTLLRQQQPVGGMSGRLGRQLVQQFRMPGYPFVLISTDVLQEGEDLHTFCSAVHHYGISWTASAMEQRIGRIDRVRSHTDRRLARLNGEPNGSELLQVYYPYLEDTVEILQVQRVFERLNLFLRMMHEGLSPRVDEERRIHVNRELTKGRRYVEAIRERLRSAFPVPSWAIRGTIKELAVSPSHADQAQARLQRLRDVRLIGVDVEWEPSRYPERLLGTVRLETGRVQPIVLLLQSEGEHLALRCVSPIGRVQPDEAMEAIVESTRRLPVRIGALRTRDDASYDLTVEDDVLLGTPEHDEARLSLLLRRVAGRADILEQAHVPGQDQAMGVFAADLSKEGRRDD